jgi:hypothetical protein
MINDSTQRIPPQGDSREDEVSGLLAAASDFARSVLESIQALAGTTSCKGVQIARLKEWAINHECWLDKNSSSVIIKEPSFFYISISKRVPFLLPSPDFQPLG